MNRVAEWQATALAHPCRLAAETMHPRFRHEESVGSILITVNYGYEWLEQGFGGPVWHASVFAPSHAPETFEALARAALEGAGDASAGEWPSWGQTCFHLRRRLSDSEALITGPVVDIRGTFEAKKRLDRVSKWLPKDWPER